MGPVWDPVWGNTDCIASVGHKASALRVFTVSVKHSAYVGASQINVMCLLTHHFHHGASAALAFTSPWLWTTRQNNKRSLEKAWV